MVIKNMKTDLLGKDKQFAKRDTSYSSFWLYNKDKDLNSEHFKDSFVNYYNDKDLLSEFNLTVAKNVISYWSEQGDIILDPFAGRTRSLISYAMNRVYIGFEVSPDVHEYLLNRYKELELTKRENFLVDVILDDCMNVATHLQDNKVDMVFTCPPYWTLEKYQSVRGQLSDIADYEIFMDELFNRLSKAGAHLKIGGYMCIVIGDFRHKGNYMTLQSDLIQRMKKDTTLKLHDLIVIQNMTFANGAFYFGKRKKNKTTSKIHEHLLVYKKVLQ